MRTAVILILALVSASCESPTPNKNVIGSTSPRHQSVAQGDGNSRGGSATVRVPHAKKTDDPTTTNDESNDQPLGHYGTVTLRVFKKKAYTLDADIDSNYDFGFYMKRLYFPRGGWVDFPSCQLDIDLKGECADENGDDWLMEGTIE